MSVVEQQVVAQAAVRPQLTGNQWKIVTFCSLAGMLETMDIYVIAFVLAVITGPWQLSYGQSAAILYASGIGAVIGSFFWGYLADHIGRKKAFIGTIITCSGASLILAFTPTGDWIFLAVMRTIIGFGAAGFFIFIVLVQEFAPAANRGFASSFVSTAAAGGLLVGALCASFLMPVFGWRGMFAIGAVPILVGIAVYYMMPESPRWALAHGKTELGRQSLSWALGPNNPDMEKIVQSYSKVEQPPSWGEILTRKRSLIVGMLINFGVVTGYYGITLWAPTLLAQILEINGAQAAKIMIGLSLTGLLSRLTMGWLSDRFGRRRCGAVAACGAALFLVIAGLVGHGDILSRDLFWLPFGLAFVLADSGFAIMGMYTSEIWPSRLRGRGSGACYAAGSVGKIAGPLGLALLIGSSNMIKPAATVSAIIPAFIFLGSVFLIAGLSYIFIARETRGQTLEELDRRLS
jgi:MFS transporter, putative metabolite:H+ symporter